jgi:hypothetical protein
MSEEKKVAESSRPESPRCPRCGTSVVDDSPSDQLIEFYGCPACGRRWAREPGERLHERWLGPISIALYGTLYAEHPQDEAERIARQLRAQGHIDLIAMVNEIRLELNEPVQEVRSILGHRTSEHDLREFLARLAELLESPSGGKAS